MLLLKSFLIFIFMILSFKSLKADESLKKQAQKFESDSYLKESFIEIKESLFKDYRYIVKQAYEASGINLENLSQGLSVDEFLRKNYEEAFRSLNSSLRSYELKQWDLGHYHYPEKHERVKKVLRSLLDKIEQKQKPEKIENFKSSEKKELGYMGEAESFVERKERFDAGEKKDNLLDAETSYQLKHAGRELLFFIENLEKYKASNENSFLFSNYFDNFYEVNASLNQSKLGLLDELTVRSELKEIIFILLAPMYRITMMQAGDASFEKLVISLLVLEKSPYFDLSYQNEMARSNTILTRLIEVYFSASDEKKVRDAFLSIRAFQYFLAKHQADKIYRHRNIKGHTPLMAGIYMLDSFYKNPEDILESQKYKSRFKQLFDFMLEHKNLKPTYFEIRYVAMKTPFFKDIISDSLEKDSPLRQALFKLEDHTRSKLMNAKTHFKNFSIRISHPLKKIRSKVKR